MPHPPKKPLPKEQAEPLLNAEVLEVHVWGDTHAAVIARMSNRIDLRWLIRVNGRWLNIGNDSGPTLEQVREAVAHNPPD